MARSKWFRTTAVVGTALAAGAGLGTAQLLAGSPAAQAKGLTPWSTCEELLEHYRGELRESATPYGFGLVDDHPVDDVGSVSFAFQDSARLAAGSGDELAAPAPPNTGTGTNLQEAGVDEPDLAKLVDDVVVSVSQGRLRVLNTDPQPALLGSTVLELPATVETHSAPGVEAPRSEVLVTGGRALVITTGYRPLDRSTPRLDSTDPTEPVRPITTAQLFELTAGDPEPVETLTVDGRYVSARLVGRTVRLVTSSTPTPPPTVRPSGHSDAELAAARAANRAAADGLQLDDVLPTHRLTTADGTTVAEGPLVDCADVAHADSATGHSTLVVTTLEPVAATGLAAVDTDAVTTDGDVVYASADRLYVATSRWTTTGPGTPTTPFEVRPDVLVGPTASELAAPDRPVPDEPAVTEPEPATGQPDPLVTTQLHAFDTSTPGRTEYVASGSVPGHLLNRWALSHHEGVLRVASTLPATWSPLGPKRATSSMVVKLAERSGELVETGRVEGLGRTEEIKSVRYFGDLAAVVTFREVDPLYLVDLAGRPRLLGELKVPGFSTYLHPIGDDLLLAVGRGQGAGPFVDRVQLSVFDVGDRSAPRLVDAHDLGRGHSEALSNAHAVTYDPDRRLATITFSPGHGRSELVGVRVGAAGELSAAGTVETGTAAGHAWRVFSTPTHLVAAGPDRLLTVEPERFATVSELVHTD